MNRLVLSTVFHVFHCISVQLQSQYVLRIVTSFKQIQYYIARNYIVDDLKVLLLNLTCPTILKGLVNVILTPSFIDMNGPFLIP